MAHKFSFKQSQDRPKWGRTPALVVAVLIVTPAAASTLVVNSNPSESSQPKQEGNERGSGEAGSIGAGSVGLGDRLYPNLGNGGIDVVHYDLKFDFDKTLTQVDAAAALDIRTTSDLTSFTLDFSGEPNSITIDGQSASFVHDGPDDIRVVPAQPLRRGKRIRVTVKYQQVIPTPKTAGPGFVPPASKDSLYLFSVFQPNSAHRAFPSNDHPSDPASFTISISSPAPLYGAANGILVERKSINGRTTRVFRQVEPIPSNVVQIAVGEWDEVTGVGPHGIVIRSFVPKGKRVAAATTLQQLGPQIEFLERHLGTFPFNVYGVVAPPKGSKYGGELETATLSLMDGDTIENTDDVSPVLVHEATHQWFGDSTSVKEWSDVWLNEGHATYYEILWQRSQPGGVEPATIYRSIYVDDALKMRKEFGPVGAPRGGEPVPFNPNVYSGGALALFALREEVGSQTFTQIEQAFLRQFRFKVASTEDYVSVASRVAQRDLRPFFRAWLGSDQLPPMPKHPDWK
jgi:aminopeptidase N